MIVPRELKIVVLLAMTCAMAAFVIAEEAFALGAGLWVLSVTGWWMTEFTASIKGVSRRLIGVAFAGIGIYTFISVMDNGVVVSLFNTALALLVGVKIWERREIRDYAQILTLSMFLGIGATLNRNSLGVGVALLLLVPILAYGAMLCQLSAGGAKASMGSARVEGTRIAGVGAGAVVAGLVISVVVFLLVPRGISPPAGFSAFGRVAGQRVSGLSDHVRLGQGGLISESQAVVMTVRMLDSDGKRIGGEGQIQYLRACVLDEYRNGLWSRSDGPGMRDFSASASEPVIFDFLRAQPSPSDIRITQYYEVRSAPTVETPVAMLYRPIAFQENPFREQVWSGAGGRTRYRIDIRDGCAVRAGNSGPVSYMVTSILNAPEPPGRSRRGEVSFPSSRLAEFAREVVLAAGIEPDPSKRPTEDDSIVARAFESALRNRCKYSLDTPSAPFDTDPTEWFVLEERTGHCEYFASALAAMCRAVGIDARVITGYVATQYDDEAGCYIIREANAHAWVEVNTAPNVWRIFDATPPADFARQHGSPEGVFSMLGRLLGDLEDVWSSQVVSFDSRAQTGLLGVRGRQMITEDWGLRAREALTDWIRSDSAKVRLSPALLWLPVAVVLLIGVRAMFNRSARVKALGLNDKRALALHRAVIDACESLGMPRSTSVPLESHAAEILAKYPVAGASIVRAVHALNQFVFAGAQPGSDEWGRLLADVSRYRRPKFRLFRLGGRSFRQTNTDSITR